MAAKQVCLFSIDMTTLLVTIIYLKHALTTRMVPHRTAASDTYACPSPNNRPFRWLDPGAPQRDHAEGKVAFQPTANIWQRLRQNRKLDAGLEKCERNCLHGLADDVVVHLR